MSLLAGMAATTIKKTNNDIRSNVIHYTFHLAQIIQFITCFDYFVVIASNIYFRLWIAQWFRSYLYAHAFVIVEYSQLHWCDWQQLGMFSFCLDCFLDGSLHGKWRRWYCVGKLKRKKNEISWCFDEGYCLFSFSIIQLCCEKDTHFVTERFLLKLNWPAGFRESIYATKYLVSLSTHSHSVEPTHPIFDRSRWDHQSPLWESCQTWLFKGFTSGQDPNENHR